MEYFLFKTYEFIRIRVINIYKWCKVSGNKGALYKCHTCGVLEYRGAGKNTVFHRGRTFCSPQCFTKNLFS